MIVNSKILAAYLGIKQSSLSELVKKNKFRVYRKTPKSNPRFILAEALDDYDKNILQHYSLKEAANKLDGWGQFNREK
jgi:hypothetical protein